MMAKILQGQVCEFAMEKGKEIASDVNIEIDQQTDYLISKVHLTPNKFFNKYLLDGQLRIILIERNYLDIFISSFFYFRYGGDEQYVLLNPSIKSMLNPIFMFRHLRARLKLNKYISDSYIKGIPNFGTLKDFILKWKQIIKKSDRLTASITSYEKLYYNTEKEIFNILSDLNIPNINEKHILKTIFEESFTQRKQILIKTEQELTHGKDFNLKFHRNGCPKDHTRFLNKKQKDKLNDLINKTNNE